MGNCFSGSATRSGTEEEEESHGQDETRDGQKFECETCKAVFTRRADLKRHQVTHSIDRPFVCDNCLACYKRKDHLYRHDRRWHHPKTATATTQTETQTEDSSSEE